MCIILAKCVLCTKDVSSFSLVLSDTGNLLGTCFPVPMFPGFCTLIAVISINRLQILPTPWYDSRLGLYLGFRFRVLVRVRVRVRLEL